MKGRPEGRPFSTDTKHLENRQMQYLHYTTASVRRRLFTLPGAYLAGCFMAFIAVSLPGVIR